MQVADEPTQPGLQASISVKTRSSRQFIAPAVRDLAERLAFVRRRARRTMLDEDSAWQADVAHGAPVASFMKPRKNSK